MLNKILDLATNRGFLKRTVLPHLNMSQFRIGPTGSLLRYNLQNEWFNNVVLNKDLAVIINEGDISETYDYTKDLFSQILPFGIADIKKLKKSYSTDEIIEYYKSSRDNKNTSFRDLMRHEEDTIFSCTFFLYPSNSTPFFHQWQRQRRMWWRKVSHILHFRQASPGRYFLTDIKKGENNSQSVEIIVKYPWGSELIETLTLNTDDRKYTSSQLEFKENRKFVHAHTIVSRVNLTPMLMNAICDAFDESLIQNKARLLMRFHKKLTPYKVSFAVTGTGQASVAELSDLALYLCKQLKSNHVSTLLLPSSSKLKLEAQFNQYDELGVPYTIILNDSTLKDGVAYLRNRETTLREQVHVSEMVSYMDQLLRN